MTLLDRSIVPQIHSIASLQFPSVDRYLLDNGIEVVEVNQGTQDIVHIEVIYDAGRPVEDKQLASRITAAIQKEGTKSFSSEALAEKIDYYGSSINSGSNLDYSYFSVFVLSKFFSEVMPMFAEVLQEPTFPESELKTHREITLEKLKSNMAKSDLVSYRKITEEMYGSEHAYGYNSSEENILAIQRSDLIHHFTNYQSSDRCTIIVSGKINENVRSIINTNLGQVKTTSSDKQFQPPTIPVHQAHHKIHSAQQHQTAIKIGRKMFNRSNEDFAPMFMLNTVLGGYFGSRLMESIRENLGYTYNIYSSLEPLVYDGYFTLNTEVSNELVDPTVAEIYNQISILQNEKISARELDMVRNYIMGNFLNMIDGPFRVANVMKTLSVSKMEVEEYEVIIDQIYNCTTTQIQEMAQKYLQRKDMIEVMVGSNF